MKWVGGVTAALSLVFAVNQVIQLVGDVRDRQRGIAELLTTGEHQKDVGNYASAWDSVEQAAKSADTGGQLAKLTGSLSSEQRRSREAQEDLAMAWVEDLSIPQGRTLSDTVDKLISVLTRGASGADGVRKADLLAHLGWAYFYKARDYSSSLEGSARLNISRHYKEALAVDPGNPYAHVHWGHLIIWTRESTDDALMHFSAAIASGRARPYVRSVQLAALRNLQDNDGAFLIAVNAMLKNDEPIAASTRRDVHSIYYVALHSDKSIQRLLAAMPATEQIGMIRTLFYGGDFDPSRIPTREASLAVLQEAAGLRHEALNTWLALRSHLATDSIYITRADDAIKRLSRQ